MTLIKIAKHYGGLTKNEFEFYMTIPAPHENRRVFYPFHKLSRLQAIATKWDWAHLVRLCQEKLKILRGRCNNHAEKAGLSEPGLNEVTLLYWMAAHFSMCVKKTKIRLPDASKEVILFHYSLDRWSLPIIPWACHAFKASICKDQDHGIAMKLGLVPTNGEAFDPLVHMDFDQCTVTIDTWCTNKAMGNYATADWKLVRSHLSKVPLWHSYWHVDLSLGNSIWEPGHWDQTITPIAPLPPALNIPLVPIDNWILDDNSPVQGLNEFQCGECTERSKTPGLLIRHYQLEHVGGGLAIREEVDVPDEAADMYWDNTCDECGESFTLRRILEHHKRRHRDLEEGRYAYKVCGKKFYLKNKFDRHGASRVEDRPFKCDECEETFKTRQTQQS
ncbi:hypothetical protein V8C35DRAFT_312099 [Trichoderma chlorosporum]